MNRFERRDRFRGSWMASIPLITIIVLADSAAALAAGQRPALLSILLGPDVKVAGLALGVDSFEKARRIYGKVQERHSGDAGYSRATICYASSDNRAPVKLAFSSGELDISARIVTEAELSTEVKGSALQECSPTRAVSRDMATLKGLKLGMGKTEIRRLLGAPTQESAGNWSYRFESRVKYRGNVGDMVTWIIVDLVDGISTTINIGRTFST